MVKVRFQQTVQMEYDTDTGKSRVLKQYATPLGKGSWNRKKPSVKPLLGGEVKEEWVE